jgi:hypothetical protein
MVSGNMYLWRYIMGEYRYISLREKPELKTAAADWFHNRLSEL